MPNPISKLPLRKQKYAQLLSKGNITKEEAKIAAGYSKNTSTSMIENSDFKNAFQQYIRKKIPVSRIAKRVSEGMNAVNTEFFQKDGKVTDSRDSINYSERRQYTTLAAQMAGYYTPKQEFDHTQKIDEGQLRRLMDIAEKISLAGLSAERIQQLEQSHVPLVESPTVIDAE